MLHPLDRRWTNAKKEFANVRARMKIKMRAIMQTKLQCHLL